MGSKDLSLSARSVRIPNSRRYRSVKRSSGTAIPEETNAPYGLAKKMLVAQLQAYRQEFGFDGINLLLVNLFGPGDNFDPQTSHVIPALIRKFVRARDQGLRVVEVWGTGKATREFMYVTDAARAIVLATEKLPVIRARQRGTGQEITIRDLAHLLAKKIRLSRRDPVQPPNILTVNPPMPRRHSCREQIGFTASTSLEEGLERTVAWYESQQIPLRHTA